MDARHARISESGGASAVTTGMNVDPAASPQFMSNIRALATCFGSLYILECSNQATMNESGVCTK
jgi:hypothetical protein